MTDPPYAETSLVWDRWPQGWLTLAMAVATQMWCFGSTRMFMDRAADFQGWHLSQDIVWEKHNGSNAFADRFRRIHELALHFYQATGGTSTKSPNSPRTPRPGSCAARAAPRNGAA